MSLSKPRENSSPVKRHFKVKGASGELAYWSKADNEEKTVETPFSFVVLDVLNAVAGYHESSKSGIWSNEIRDTRDERLTVRSRDGVLVEGLWSEISDRAKALGGKFANSVFIGFKDGDELAIGNILLSGAALSAFFDFKKGKNLDNDPGVSITGFDGPFKKGRTEYFVPKFGSWTPNDLSAAEGLDRTLQDYLSGSASTKSEEASAPSYSAPQQTSFGEPLQEEPPF